MARITASHLHNRFLRLELKRLQHSRRVLPATKFTRVIAWQESHFLANRAPSHYDSLHFFAKHVGSTNSAFGSAFALGAGVDSSPARLLEPGPHAQTTVATIKYADFKIQ